MQEQRSDSEVLRSIEKNVNEQRAMLFGVNGTPGFVSVATVRLNDHAKSIDFLKKFAWTLAGGGAVLAFMFAHHMLAAVK